MMNKKLLTVVLSGAALAMVPLAAYGWYSNYNASVSPVTYSAGWQCSGGICNSVPATGYVAWNTGPTSTQFYPSTYTFTASNNYGASVYTSGYNYSSPAYAQTSPYQSTYGFGGVNTTTVAPSYVAPTYSAPTYSVPAYNWNTNNQVVCTQDARQCSDGSWVSRTGPNCSFAQCPTYTYNNPYNCPAGYAYYGMPLGCAPLSYINYCHYNTDACPLGAFRQ